MSADVANLVVSTLENRVEIAVPLAFLESNDISRITSFLRESEVDVPSAPMLTKGETDYMFHETPQFG